MESMPYNAANARVTRRNISHIRHGRHTAATAAGRVGHGRDRAAPRLKGAAACALHPIVTDNDDRARTLHNVAERTDRELLPASWRHH